MEIEAVGVHVSKDRDYLLNVLNEVLHGFPVDFEEQLHRVREDAAVLLGKLNDPAAQHKLDARDARLMIDASRLCEAQFDEPEFHTRLGFSKKAAHETVSRLERRAGLGTTRQTQAAAS